MAPNTLFIVIDINSLVKMGLIFCEGVGGFKFWRRRLVGFVIGKKKTAETRRPNWLRPPAGKTTLCNGFDIVGGKFMVISAL